MPRTHADAICTKRGWRRPVTPSRPAIWGIASRSQNAKTSSGKYELENQTAERDMFKYFESRAKPSNESMSNKCRFSCSSLSEGGSDAEVEIAQIVVAT